MASNQLTASSGTGTQNSTQTPQSSAVGGNIGGQSSSSVQPTTTAATFLSSTGGIPLINTPVPTVTLGQPSTATIASTTAPATQHTISPIGIGIAAILFLVAIGLFWATFRSAKNTTI